MNNNNPEEKAIPNMTNSTKQNIIKGINVLVKA